MKNIIAAQFDDFAHADAALHALNQGGSFVPDDVDQVALGPAGRHDRDDNGDQPDADASSVGAEKGAADGAAVGAVTGAAAGAVLGPLGAVAGAAVGAYTGSLAGALDKLSHNANHPEPAPRPPGVMVMVHVRTPEQRDAAVAVFQAHSARGIEEAGGTWSDGTWSDFDPEAPAQWLVAPTDSQVARAKPKQSR